MGLAQTRKVEARKLEHLCPHAFKVQYRESQHSSCLIHFPTFWASPYIVITYLGVGSYYQPLVQNLKGPYKTVGFGRSRSGLRVSGFQGFWSLGFRGFGVWGFWSLGFRVSGVSGFRWFPGLGKKRIWSSGFRGEARCSCQQLNWVSS